jgi:hypothetical protein
LTGFKYLGSQRQNTPVFKAINPLLILSSACMVASQLVSTFLDEGDGVSFGQVRDCWI